MIPYSEFSFENDKLDAVLKATSNLTTVPVVDGRSQLMLVSRKQQPPNIKELIRKLQYGLRAYFGTRVLVTGGGYGCFKITIHIEGDSDEVKKTNFALEGGDNRILKLLDDAKVDFVVDTKTQQRTKIEPESGFSKDAEVKAVLKTIPELKKQINSFFGRKTEQARTLQDFLRAFDEHVAALTSPTLGAPSDIAKFKYLGDLLIKADAKANPTIERMTGCLELLAAIRFC